MTRPSWLNDGGFWKRNPVLATEVEDALNTALTVQLAAWLKEIEQVDGPAAKEGTECLL